MLEKIHKYRAGGILGVAMYSKFACSKYKRKDPEFYDKLCHMYDQLKRAYICNNLRKKLKKQIDIYKNEIVKEYNALPHAHEKVIWVCWLKGIENAPKIVRMCYQSILDNFSKDYKIITLSDDNIDKYITLPEYIVEKYKSGVISPQLYSDAVRLELLDKYGGTWMDATIFCSGGAIPKFMLEDDLFTFQMLWYATWGMATVTNLFFLSACQNNKIIKLTKYLFFNYLKHHDIMADYWLIDDMFDIAIKEFPDEWSNVVPVECLTMHVLQDHLRKHFDKRLFDITISRMPFHKLTWRVPNEGYGENTLCNYLFSKYPIYGENNFE